MLEAHIIKGLLESFDIPAFILDEHFFYARYRFASPLVHVRIQVHSPDAKEAKEILLAHDQGVFQINLEEEFEIPKTACSACGSDKTREATDIISLAISVFSAFYLIGIVMPPKKYKICKECKKKYL